MNNDTTDTVSELRRNPHAVEGARAWAMGVAYTEGAGLDGLARQLWEWGWRDAELGYRLQVGLL